MDDWDIPLQYPEDDDDFEDRYADEMEIMDDIGSGFPQSRKSLKFDDPSNITEKNNIPELSRKHDINEIYGAIPNDEDDDDDVLNTTDKNIPDLSKKHDIDEVYGPIPDDEEGDNDAPDFDMAVLSPIRKRQRKNSPDLKDSSDMHVNAIQNEQTRTIQGEPINVHYGASSLPSQDQSRNTSSQDQPHNTPRTQKRIYRRPPMSQECITLTQTNGRRLYLGIDDNKADEHVFKHGKRLNSVASKYQHHQLLQVPFEILKQQVSEQRRRKANEESEKVVASLKRALDGDSELDDAVEPEDEEGPVNHGLWVEKYSPQHFTELLSDDAINRTLLRWLKLWDKVVFKKDVKPKKQPIQKQQKEKFQGKDFKKFGIESEEWTEVDANGHPVHKVALLCGPPGLGKTTLAHVIARHAGYNVVEMNASDDRAVDVFRQKIEVATQMKSVLGANERPNCLVIDEIDGAPTPAINVLLSVIKSKVAESEEGKKGKKKNKNKTLSRPIICICNDQFVPALRQLRQQALVAVFPQTVPGKLSGRLLEISRREGVTTDMTTLLSLCDKAENDIRSCLNTLQFVHRRHGRLSLQHVQSSTVGQKDAHKNLFTIWHEIFQLPKPKRKRFAALIQPSDMNHAEDAMFSNGAGDGLPHSQQNVSSLTTRFHNILRLAYSSGQYDKLTQGLFENYLNIKFKDTGLKAVVAGTDWLEFADFVEQRVLHSQSFMLRGYSPFLSVAFHLHYATPTSSKLSYPSSQYECYLREVKTTNLLVSLKGEASPRIRQVLNLRIALLDLFPLLLEIITPTLRPVNTQLFSAREKKQLVELIDTMIAYNLTYHQERNFDGQYNYSLDPNIEEALKFPGLPQHKQLTYATKQLIAREIDLEKMRRAENIMLVHAQDLPGQKENQPKQKKKEKPNVVLKLQPSKAKVQEEKIALDFFGRPIKRKEAKNSSKGSGKGSDQSQDAGQVIWFRFNEGYSNAVRKNIKIQDFL